MLLRIIVLFWAWRHSCRKLRRNFNNKKNFLDKKNWMRNASLSFKLPEHICHNRHCPRLWNPSLLTSPNGSRTYSAIISFHLWQCYTILIDLHWQHFILIIRSSLLTFAWCPSLHYDDSAIQLPVKWIGY